MLLYGITLLLVPLQDRPYGSCGQHGPRHQLLRHERGQEHRQGPGQGAGGRQAGGAGLARGHVQVVKGRRRGNVVIWKFGDSMAMVVELCAIILSYQSIASQRLCGSS